MRVFERYILSGVLLTIGYVFLVMLALFSFFEFLGLLSSVSREGGFTVGQAMLVSLYRAPAQAYQAVPIAVLVGALISLAQLARNSELSVLRVSGVSTRRLLGALFKAAALVAILTFVWGETVAPAGDRAAQGIRSTSFRQKSGLELRSGFWLKDGTNYVNIREVRGNARLTGVYLYEFSADGALQALRVASEGDFVKPGTWRLRDINEIRYATDGSATRRTIAEELWTSTLSPDILGVLNVRPDKMSAVTLAGYVAHLSANRQASDRYQVALWKRLVYPMTCFVMVALALPFAYFQGRTAGAGLRLFLGAMLGVSFYVFDGLSSNLGLINRWPAAVSALGPSVLYLLIALALVWWVERR